MAALVIALILSCNRPGTTQISIHDFPLEGTRYWLEFENGYGSPIVSREPQSGALVFRTEMTTASMLGRDVFIIDMQNRRVFSTPEKGVYFDVKNGRGPVLSLGVPSVTAMDPALALPSTAEGTPGADTPGVRAVFSPDHVTIYWEHDLENITGHRTLRMARITVWLRPPDSTASTGDAPVVTPEPTGRPAK